MSYDNKNSRSIEDEVRKLFKSNNGKISNQDFISLRLKYQDVDIVEKIQQLYLEKYEHINKKAKKFARLIKEKYNNNQYPFHILLEKARLYKQKHNLTDEEFAEFQRIYEQELIGMKSSEVIIPFNNMSKLLGNVNVQIQNQMKFSDSEVKHLQEIIKLYSSSKTLHAAIQLQSFQYNDLADEAINGTFKRELGNNSGDHIHPVIAALFLPKIDYIDNLLLLANLAAVVKVRSNGEAFITRADYDLFWALTNDPNDIVCDSTSPMLDLLNRTQVQISLWSSVLSLRNGQYFNPLFRQFMSSVDMCKLNRYDNPDLIYGRSDGIVMKRLLSCFSVRPTHIATTPVMFGETLLNPYNQQIRPVVTTIPMYNFKLPIAHFNNDDNTPVKLSDAFEQKQYFIENNKFITKNTKLIWSHGVLIIHIDRFSDKMLKYKEFSNQPYNIAKLPKSIGGDLEMNMRPVDFDMSSFNINGMSINLKSVVITNYSKANKIILGSSALLVKNPNTDTHYYYYDPNGVNRRDAQNNEGTPCREIVHESSDNTENFMTLASTLGSIFVYECADV